MHTLVQFSAVASIPVRARKKRDEKHQKEDNEGGRKGQTTSGEEGFEPGTEERLVDGDVGLGGIHDVLHAGNNQGLRVLLIIIELKRERVLCRNITVSNTHTQKKVKSERTRV